MQPKPAASNASQPQSQSQSQPLSLRVRRTDLAHVRHGGSLHAVREPVRREPREPSAPESFTSIWSPVVARPHAQVPSSSEVIHRNNASTAALSPEHEARLIAALMQPARPDENHREAGARKEHEVADILMQLGEIDAYQLQRRLTAARPDDPLVIAFGRLVIERRQRLLAALERHRRGQRGRKAAASGS
jgi:hypothetical protein